MTAKTEFGDFQTPPELAEQVANFLASKAVAWKTLVEPSVGLGNLVVPALQRLPSLTHCIFTDISPDYVEALNERLSSLSLVPRTRSEVLDSLRIDWQAYLRDAPDQILVLTNPPWVTSARLTRIGGSNLPVKANTQGHRGLDAVTGKSNFDVSEWMLQHLIAAVGSRMGAIAALCKTSVARRLLDAVWSRNAWTPEASIHRIDALKAFDASVDACLFYLNFGSIARDRICHVFDSIESSAQQYTIGHRAGSLVSNVSKFDRTAHLRGPSAQVWRSGIKHDCSKVMEFRKIGDDLINGLGVKADIEPLLVYPMAKSSDVANANRLFSDRFMLVTQHTVGEDTGGIEHAAPKTWAYLQEHAHLLDARGSSIYRRRPRFAIFGVGSYSFLPWKVAISGLYKHLRFRLVSPQGGKPTVLDDTCYFIGFETEAAARTAILILQSPAATDFYSSLIFWDSKRPITSEILNQFDLFAAGFEAGLAETDLVPFSLGTSSVSRQTSLL